MRDPEEWAAEFAAFRGRTFLFDDVVRRDNEGRPVLGSYVVEVKGEVVRLALEDLDVLRDLPLDEGPRMLFGARLAQCDREEGGSWVIHFAPDSGVLLTDLEAAEAASPGRPLDPGLKETLQRQQQWLDESGPWRRRGRESLSGLLAQPPLRFGEGVGASGALPSHAAFRAFILRLLPRARACSRATAGPAPPAAAPAPTASSSRRRASG